MNFYLKDLVYRHPKANDLIFDKNSKLNEQSIL